MSPTRSPKKMPWQSKGQWIWLMSSLILSVFLIVYMPQGGDRDTPRNKESRVSQTKTSASENTTNTQHRPIKKITKEEKNTPAEPRKMKHRKTSSNTPSSTTDRILKRLSSFSSLFFMVALAALIGSIIEARRWHLIFGYLLGGFARFMRLPSIVSLAMPTALYSSIAANSLLVSGHEEGKIKHSALIAGGMANSFLIYLSHSLRVAYPVIGALGITGFCYFLGQFSLGFLFIMGVLFWHRRRIDKTTYAAQEQDTDTGKTIAVTPWKKTFLLAGRRVGRLIFRMLCMTVPIILIVEYLTKQGTFQFWEKHAPEWVQRVFPSELMGIVLAQLGGLIQSASVASELRDQGLVTNPQILLAMFIGSIIGNPIRTMRRNLPSALGIFQAKDALTIVVGMQTSRFICTFVLIVIMSLYIHFTH